jgi:hypothetical protein
MPGRNMKAMAALTRWRLPPDRARNGLSICDSSPNTSTSSVVGTVAKLAPQVLDHGRISRTVRFSG